MLIVKNIENNSMYNMQELHSSSFLWLRVIVNTKLNKTADPIKFFFNKSKHFILIYYSFIKYL